MYYVEDDHEAIIDPRIWECVRLEFKRREKYLKEHGTPLLFQKSGDKSICLQDCLRNLQ